MRDRSAGASVPAGYGKTPHRLRGLVLGIIIAMAMALALQFTLHDVLPPVRGTPEDLPGNSAGIALAVLTLMTIVFLFSARRRGTEIRKALEEGRRKDDRLLQMEQSRNAIVTSLSEGIMVFDGRGRITTFNRMAELTFAIHSDPAGDGWYTGEGVAFLRPDGSRMPQEEWVVTRVFRDRLSISNQQLGIESPDGRVTWVMMNAVPTFDGAGNIEQVVASVTDVSDLYRTEEERSRATTTNAILEAMGDGLVLLNMDGVITTVNRAFEVMTGYAREELVGMYGANLISNLLGVGRDSSAVEKIRISIEKEQRPYGAIILQTKGGVEIPTAITASYLRDEDGIAVAIITIFKNISNILMLEDALRESNERFQQITAYANDAIFLVDDLGRISYWNPAAEKIFGYSKIEAEGRKLTQLILPRQLRENLQERMLNPPMEGEPFLRRTVESIAKRKNGEEFPIELSFSTLILRGSFHIVGIVRDISERKGAERALRESEELQRALFEGSIDPVIITDLLGRVIRANPAVERVFGYRPGEILGAGFPGNAGFGRGTMDEWIAACRTGNGVSGYEAVILNSTGTEVPVSISISPIFDSSGKLISLSFWYRDVTEKKRTEEKLRFQAHLLNSVRESIVATDLDGRITYWGRGAEKLYQYPAHEILGKLISLFVDSEDALVEAERVRLAMATGSWHGESLQRRQDLSTFWADRSLSLVDDMNGQPAGIISITRDITDLKSTGEALQESEERYRIMTETVFTGIAMADQDGQLLFVNSAFSEMTGYSREELTGMSLYGITDIQEFRGHLTPAPVGKEGRTIYESTARRKDGTVLSVLIAVAPLSGPGGLFTGTLCAFIDITERSQAEERIRASLEEKEILLKEVHHRVKNNLQVVSSLLYLQSQQLEEESAKGMLRESQNRVKSMALVHERLYQSDDLARINFAEYIRNLGYHLFDSYGSDPERVTMNLNVEDILLSIEVAIPCGLIINELISNALKHAFPIDGRGTITITLGRETAAPIPGESEGEGQLFLSVADNGIGLPENIELGTIESMGLHLVNTLIRQIDATISIDRTHGTRFEIRFAES